MPVPVARSGSLRVAYGVAGRGPGLVLVPGTGGSGDAVWGHLCDRFADRWTVVTPDLEDAGEASSRHRPLELEDLVEQVVTAAVDAEVEPFDLVGYSLGSAVAVGLAAERGDLVRSLVLVAGVVRNDACMRLQLGLWRDLFERDRESLARLLVQNSFGASHLSAISSEELEGVVRDFVATIPAGFGRQCELGLRIDLEDACRRIRARTLVVGLTRDHVVPVAQVRALHEAIRGSAYAEIDSGHMVVFERPDELVLSVREFVGGAADEEKGKPA